MIGYDCERNQATHVQVLGGMQFLAASDICSKGTKPSDANIDHSTTDLGRSSVNNN